MILRINNIIFEFRYDYHYSGDHVRNFHINNENVSVIQVITLL